MKILSIDRKTKAKENAKLFLISFINRFYRKKKYTRNRKKFEDEERDW